MKKQKIDESTVSRQEDSNLHQSTSICGRTGVSKAQGYSFSVTGKKVNYLGRATTKNVDKVGEPVPVLF